MVAVFTIGKSAINSQYPPLLLKRTAS